MSVCHCLDCQRRTGSAFGVQARFSKGEIEYRGASKTFERKGDTGSSVTFRFCPHCGTTVCWNPEKLPDQTSVAVGAFAEPNFVQELDYTVYESRRHAWLGELNAVEHYD